MCLRDNIHLDYRDSIIGAVKEGLNNRPIYFKCFPNSIIRLRGVNILDWVVIHRF